LYFEGEDFNARPLIHIDSPAYYVQDSIYLMQSAEFRNLMISKDGKSLALAAFNKTDLNALQKDSLLEGIEKQLKTLDFNQYHLASKIRIERVYVQEIIKNLKKYLLLSVLSISLVLFFLFRSIQMVVFQLLIIAASLIWTLSVISFTGGGVDIITSLIPPVLAAICMSDIIHISAHYIELLRIGLDKETALKQAFAETGRATFFTCLIVAAGFLSLSFTDIIPVRNFGFYAAAGIMLSFVVAVSSLYAYFRLTDVPKIASSKSNEMFWTNFLLRMFQKIIRYRRLTVALAGIAIIASIWLMTFIKKDAGLLQEIPREHPMLKDYQFIDEHFSGTRPFEMVLTVKDSIVNLLDPFILEQVGLFERFLEDSCQVGALISPLSMLKGAHKAHKGGKPGEYRLPETIDQLNRYTLDVAQSQYAGEWVKYMHNDQREMRISGRLPDLTLHQFQEIRERIAKHFKSSDLDLFFSYHLTGEAVLLDQATLSLTKNLIPGIVADLILLSLVAIFILRSFRAVFSMLVPNVLPVLVMAAVMGVAGIYLKADTSVIFAIALAIVADDTIHFLSRFKMERNKGKSVLYALKRTYLSTGKAIILTTFILLSGFLILLTSSFGGAFYIGFLISLCLLIALITELTLTPLMIWFFQRQKKSNLKGDE
jgi:predicted RND superfamily exporter protein